MIPKSHGYVLFKVTEFAVIQWCGFAGVTNYRLYFFPLNRILRLSDHGCKYAFLSLNNNFTKVYYCLDDQ